MKIKFADKPNEDTEDLIINILIDSYKSRIMKQEPPEYRTG